MSEKGLRYNEGKPQLSYLLDFNLAAEGVAARAEMGAKKYERNNWKKGLGRINIIDSLMRHLKAYHNGETVDPIDGGYHVDAISWNALALAEEFHKERLNEP